MERVNKMLNIDELQFFMGELIVWCELWRRSKILTLSELENICLLIYLIEASNLNIDQIVHNVNIHLAYQFSKNVVI